MRMDRHHLLEIILWPNGDGTVSKIINTAKSLIELGIYYDWKLTITIPAGEHSSMHSRNRSDDTKLKMSAAQIGNTNATGYKHSEETKSKMSAAKKGKKRKKFTSEHRAKMSAVQKGKKHSEEAKAKMSAAKKGIEFTSEHRANLSAAISAAHKGLHWYTNGVVNKFAKECPPGFTIGRIYKRKRVAK